MDFYFSALILGLCLSLMALGIFISMKIFRIPDITTDGSYTLGAVVAALCLTKGLPVAATIPIVLLAGAIAGAVTGLVHTRLRIDALLSGILVMTALYSVNLSLLGRSNVPLLNVAHVFNLVQGGITAELVVSLVFSAVALFLIGYVLKTDFGIAMRATGNSTTMSRAAGVHVDRMKIIGLAIANALTALSGFLVCQYQSFTDINMGIGIVIIGLGSVLIGDAVIAWFRISNLWLQLMLVVAGSIIFQMVLAFVLSIGVDPNLLKLATAVFVLLIVALPVIKRRAA
ncbi:MAG: ABC transporter permease [Sphingobacteriales bacterium]|nr:MAG: ABC transporter permease [Sphingobacteriales bacterium]